MIENEKTFNVARQKAFDSLYITLDTLYGKCNISEIDFKNEWYNNLKKQNDIQDIDYLLRKYTIHS